MQISDDGERTVLVKLKTECGYQFTSKLESMFTDIKTSRDMMQDFKSHLQTREVQEVDAVDLSVQACTCDLSLSLPGSLSPETSPTSSHALQSFQFPSRRDNLH